MDNVTNLNNIPSCTASQLHPIICTHVYNVTGSCYVLGMCSSCSVCSVCVCVCVLLYYTITVLYW